LVSALDADMGNGTLPQVSWVIAPTVMSEHANNKPMYGEDLTARLLKVLAAHPDVYNNTAFILNYDEQGGFFDHAMPPQPPDGGAGDEAQVPGPAALDEAAQARVKKQLQRNLEALKRLARFAPYAAGAEFTVADCAAYATLPTVAQATKAVLGEDLVAAAGIDWKAHLKLIGTRASVQRVNADRKRDQEAAAAAAAARSGS
jgi:phospholipase C